MDYHKQRFIKVFTAVMFVIVKNKTKQKAPKYPTSKLFLNKSWYRCFTECIVTEIAFMKIFNEMEVGIWYTVILGKIFWSKLSKLLSMIYKFTQILIST